MKRFHFPACALALLIASSAGAAPAPELAQLAQSVTGPQDQEPIARLRAAGPEGLEAMLQAHPETAMTTSGVFGERRSPIDDAVDQIAGQRDARFSRLYWYTDLEQAKARAAATGRPVLSLRLLGKLTDDLSCANSRFFRTVLYANQSVSDSLRENFVLHWESVRPVPVIEVDYGDGRKVRRTITGNSIHYVLDSRGRTVDGLPGLYGASTFLKLLQESAVMARHVANQPDELFQESMAEYHRSRLQTTMADKAELLAADAPPTLNSRFAQPLTGPAAEADKKAPTKSILEAPPLRQVTAAPLADAELDKLAAAFGEESRLDAASRRVVAFKNPDLAMRSAMSKSAMETPLLRMVRNLESNIARDTAKNEFELHVRLRQWLAEAEAPLDLRALNERVYTELFLTPSADPWLGLVPPDTYAALDQQGLSGQGDAVPFNIIPNPTLVK